MSQKKQKVLLMSQHFYPEIGSAANRMKNLYIELKEKQYDVKVLTLHPRYPNPEMYRDERFWNEEMIDEEEVIRIDPSIKSHSGSIIKRLVLYLEVMLRFIAEIFKLKKEYDVIFVTSPPIFVGVAGLIAKWRLKTDLILDVRDLWPESLTGVKVFTNRFILSTAYKIESLLYRKATRIIVNSRSFINYMTSKGVPQEKISFMPNSLTEEELSPHSFIEEKEGTIEVIYTGNLGLAQDIQKLIQVAVALKEEKAIRFTIVGYGHHVKELQNVIDEKELHHVTLHSAKSRKETLDLVAKSDIAYVSLVEQEVFKTVLPGKIIDYMSVKKPIIGDVLGYAKEIITTANCGIVSERNTVDELVQNIMKLAKDKQLRRELGENGYKYAYEHLRWKTNINVLINVMEDIHE
jgi:glycosyltransferase involved in cell wall biosynthesis